MPEDVENNFSFPKFTTPVEGMLREVLDNNTKTRDKISLNGLGVTKCEYGGVSMIIKIVTEVSHYYTVLN